MQLLNAAGMLFGLSKATHQPMPHGTVNMPHGYIFCQTQRSPYGLCKLYIANDALGYMPCSVMTPEGSDGMLPRLLHSHEQAVMQQQTTSPCYA